MPSPKIANIGKYKLTAIADTPDFRDYQYQPALVKLADKIDRPARLKILDQGTEGSCTGFALAAVVNLLRKRHGERGYVSPRMLYEMAKRHDEWRGFRYEGSSCRGAIRGWYNMGVCLEKSWPYVDNEPGHLVVKAAKEASDNTIGAYYRLGTRISDFHAALNEAGIIYCSADIHAGWERPSKQTGVIPISDESIGGHAFAIVGYNEDGFWVQNSWGKAWGDNGTALWKYEDWQRNIADAWVLRLALSTPQIWHLPSEGGSDANRAEGLFKKTPTRAEIAGHFVHIDDGVFHTDGRYWSTPEDVQQTADWVANSDKYDHLVLYAHGGLISVAASARRDNGTALWKYEDWQRNIADAWVLRLALSTPQIWHLPSEGGSDANRAEGLFKKTPTRAEIAGHFVHIDDGVFHTDGRYWSTPEDVQQTADWVANSDKYDHLVLYAHGGLISVAASARRIAAMKTTFKKNRIYPYHFMYDTGLLEELKDVISGAGRKSEDRAGGLTDWTDKLIEKASHKAGRAVWREMKRGAESPFDEGGAGRAVLEMFMQAFEQSGKPRKIHIVGHSTGGILHAYLVTTLATLYPEIRIATTSLLAPAGTVELFRDHYRPLLKAETANAGIDRMDIYNLSDKLELDDSVAGIYRKSLLYLVSRSFEENPRPAKILGMQKYSRNLDSSLSNLNIHFSDGDVSDSKRSKSESHGGFDNDPTTMNTVMRRILRKTPAVPFTNKSLRY